jgi:hypothetical protein
LGLAEVNPIREGLYDLLQSVSITTKERGKTKIKPWLSQRIIIDSISDGLANDVHEFCILKPRQVAASTTCTVVQLFWALLRPGVQGAIIADSTANLERFRRVFADLLESLPPEWRGQGHKLIQNNRTGLVFQNGSVIDLMAAGSNPDLGASRALNCGHFTECALWRSLSGVESLRASLARENPNRLFVWESIASGLGNWFYDFWLECKEDTRHKRAIFLGFYTQPYYRIEQSHEDFNAYWDGELTEEEKIKVDYVKENYHLDVPPEAVAWRRRESEFRDPDYMDRMFPFTERECFLASGRSFFPARRVLELSEALATPPLYRGYRYYFDEDFRRSGIVQINDPEQATLRVYEHPVNEDTVQTGEPQAPGVYVIGIDPSGGGGGDADDHAIQVLRCYADKCVQVAEFQTNQPLTYQIAWCLAHLAGAYKDHTANLEVTGIGAAVMPEVFNLRRLAEMGYLVSEPGRDPILDQIGSVRWWLYNRVDSYNAGGSLLNFKTNPDSKALIYSELRDSLMLRRIEIRSIRLLKQLQAIVEDQGYIGAAPDAKVGDDLVSALVLAHHVWITRTRNDLLARQMTFDSVHVKPPMDDPSLVLSYAFSQHMRQVWSKAAER